MIHYIKNATDGVAFLFDVIKQLFKIHFKNKSIIHNTKSGRRFLAGALAVVLILATLLGDVSVAYAQTDIGFIPVENDAVTSEASEDETIKEEFTEEKNTESEIEAETPTPTPTSAPVDPGVVDPTAEEAEVVTPTPVIPVIDEPIAETTPTVTPSVDKPVAEVPTLEVTPTEAPSEDKPVVEETPSETPEIEKPVVEELSDETTSSDTFEVEMITDESSEEEETDDETEKDEDKASEDMPAISVVKTVDDYEISIECCKGTFAEGTTVEIKKVEGEEKKETDKLVGDAIAENNITDDAEIVKIVSFDITFYDKDGKEVEPADRNSVSVKIVPSEQDKAELEKVDVSSDDELLCSVFHIEDDEKVEEIECEASDPVEEVTFEAESFSVYSIVWYQNGVQSDKGPDEIGEFVKTAHSFIDITLPLQFENEGNPVDSTLRPKAFLFDVYGRDATGGVGVNHDEVHICQVTIPIEYYNGKTISLKESNKSKTEIPVYVARGTQAVADGGKGGHKTDGFEYTIKLAGLVDTSIYTVQQETTDISISWFENEAEWTGEGNQTLVVERQTLSPKKFYVSWLDNRNEAGKRPYSEVDDFASEDAKNEFKSKITLYRQVGAGPIEPVVDSMLPTTLDESGPIVDRKDGKSISDWEITYNNLPASSDSGESIKYYITLDDTDFNANYTTVRPGDWVSLIDSEGVEKQVLLSGSTAKYIYSEDFTAKVEWYDANNTLEVRLSPDNLAKEFVIKDDEGKIVLNGETDWNKVIWEKSDPTETEWAFRFGPLPMYNEQGGEKSYNLVLKDGVIKADKIEAGVTKHKYEYSVDYSNVPKTTAHNNCLSGGKVILVIDRPLDDFRITKEWSDDHDYERRKEAVESGVRFLLWRYPEYKINDEGIEVAGTPADGAAVFHPEAHTQYSYTLKTNDSNVVDAEGRVKDSINITLAEFGVTDVQPVDMFDQNGYKYIYYATEVISKSGYKTVYTDVGDFTEYSKIGVMNGGKMTNIRQEKIKMEGIVKWNVPSVNDYTKTTVTIELQKYDDINNKWITVPSEEGKVYTTTLSGFTVTKPKNSHIFPEVEKYNENGEEIKYRIVQTNVNYEKVDKPLTYTDKHDSDSSKPQYKEFVSNEYDLSGKKYTATAAPTLETDNSYTIENRLAGDMELILTKLWRDNDSGKGFGKSGCKSYQNITIKVFQHGTSTDYLTPYMTITTGGDGTDMYFKEHGAVRISDNDIPCTITYRNGSTEDGIVKVTRSGDESDGRASQWEFKKEVDGNLVDINLPAFNENGNAYSYTVEEIHVDGAYTTYRYTRTGNELAANITNTYVDGGNSIRTVIFQKEWIDGTDIPQEKPVRIAIVRTDADGNLVYSEDEKIDLRDINGNTHIVKLTDENNWYSQHDINLSDFYSKGEGADKRYLYTAIELDMARSGTSDFTRGVNYDKDSINASIYADINDGPICDKITGSIDAYLDSSHEENHLPGYDVTVSAEGASVVGASKYVVANKRKGIVNVVFDKTWKDGSNSENTRIGTHRVYLYQNGKKVVTDPAPSNENETSISGIISPAEMDYTTGEQENTHEFRFDGLPQYDADGNIYHYSVKEFLVKDGKEIEIALTDTKDSSKSGYIVSSHSENTHFKKSVSDNSILERNDTYEYTNTVTGEKTGGAKFYVLWHDQSSYDKGNRPDVNYVLYCKAKGSDEEPQVYTGEYKVEWFPMYDDNDEGNPQKASRYFQYVNFTKLPLANDEGVPYEYYAVPSLNNPGDHYREDYFESYLDVEPAFDEADNHITTSAGRYHYDLIKEATPLTPEGSHMLPENGVVEYTIYEYIHVEGKKLWKLADNGNIDMSKRPDAEVYLWSESDHDKEHRENTDVSTCLDVTELNDDKSGYAFKKDGKYIEYPKYDKYGQVYKYTVTEKIYINSDEHKYEYSIPNYVMAFRPDTNGITNVYNPENTHNLRSFKVTKNWDLGGQSITSGKNPVAEFRLYRVEVPLNSGFYKVDTISDDKILSVNPQKPAYSYAVDEFNNYKAGKSSAIEVLETKTIKYGDSKQYAVWDDMPIYASSGQVYLYLVEELNKDIESFDFDVILEPEDERPAVGVIGSVDTDSTRNNILIKYNDIPKKNDRVRAVLFSNYGLDPSKAEGEAANHQETAYKNTFKKDDKFGMIVGYKTWKDSIFKDQVRPEIGADGKCPEVNLILKRSAATQTGHGNQITTVTIPSTSYDVNWEQNPDNSDEWKFVITPSNSAEEFKLYATNGRPYTYTVTEVISGTTLYNYAIEKNNVTGSISNVTNDTMTINTRLQNKLKGEIKLFKKWDDALNEHNLRSKTVKVVLQYRLVPDGYDTGKYNESNETCKWKTYGSKKDESYTTYTLMYDNKWGETVKELPVKSKTINGVNYKYEYRLLETEYDEIDFKATPIKIDAEGNAINVPANVKVPDGGTLDDSPSGTDRNTVYGNSTSPDYLNKCYEIEIGNHVVNNSEIARLNETNANVSNMMLRVDNRLTNITSLKIEKNWDGVNVGEAIGTPEDTYGILPDSLTFYIVYKVKDSADEWKYLLDSANDKVTVTINRNKDDNSYINTYTNLPLTGENGQVLIYHAVEAKDNLGRFDDVVKYEYDPDVIDSDNKRTICHTIVTNTLSYRDITVKKRWNAEDDGNLRKNVTVELWSDNFTTSKDGFLKVNNTTKVLEAKDGWETTYKNLPKFNTEHKEIRYYVMETKVGGAVFDNNEYAVHFYDQTSETSYNQVVDRYDSKSNIAPIPGNAYKMYVVNTPKTSLKVTKKWDDENNRQGIRADVNVTLTNDGGFSVLPATQTLKTTVNSSVTWNYLPMYKQPDVNFVKGSMEHMSKVNYTVTEADTLKPKGYETPEYSFDGRETISDNGNVVNLNSSNNNATITNTYHPPKIKFTASKIWDDEGNRHLSRPDQRGIDLTLYYSTDNATWTKVKKLSADYAGKNYPDGANVYTISNVTQHVQDNGTNKWGTPVWEGLPTKVSNKAIYYKAFESDENGEMKVTPGYSASYSPDGINVGSIKDGSMVSQEITNKLELTSMVVSKEWKDTYDVADRPDSVSFVLEYRCGAMDWRVFKKEDGSVLKVTLTGSDHKPGSSHIWEKEVDKLPAVNSEGIKYEYRVKEISIAYGKDEVLAYGVVADETSGSLFTHDNDSWKSESTVGAFKNSVAVSTSQEGKDGKHSYKATAVNNPITGKLTVVKKWDDECNRDNLRPKEIKLQLYRKQDKVAPVKYGEAVVVRPGSAGTNVSDDNNEWSYTFDKLPVYNNDVYEHTEENKSIYYVMEVDSEHKYEVSYTNEQGETTVQYDSADNLLEHNSDNTYSTTEVITNKYTPTRISITAHKEWIDDNNSHEYRPNNLKFKLQYHIVGTPDVWVDVEHVSSEAELDKFGTKVQTTSDVEKTLKSNDSDPANIWKGDIGGNPVIWENLPAYVNNGAKVEYRLIEYDSSDTPDGKKISKHYSVIYDQCEYEDEYGKEYTLRATNLLKGLGGILEVDKKWDPEYKDDIAENDKVVVKIKCHIEQRSKSSLIGDWVQPETWGAFELSHENNWQYIFPGNLTSLAVYRVVEDAIVYANKDGSGEKEVVATGGNRVGSFEWEVSPKEIVSPVDIEVGEDKDNVTMQATITNTIPDNSITVSKVWEDENNRESKRPHSITVRLKRDGNPVGEDVILYPETDQVDGPWETYTWNNLPTYQNGTTEFSEYTIEEVVDEEADDEFIKAYEISYKIGNGEAKDACDGITFNTIKPQNVEVTIKNRHETHKETITASKIWKDENNKYKSRPKKLLGDYHTYLMLLYKLEGQDNWEPVNYYSDYADFEKRGYQYPDHHIYTTSPVIQEVTGDISETWDKVVSWENVSTRGVDGTYSDSNQDKNVLFMVIEVPGLDYKFLEDMDNSREKPKSIAPAGYSATESNIFDPEKEQVIVEFAYITNTLITTSLEVEKTWDDNENQFVTRPDKIRVKLERKLKSDENDPNKKWHSVEQIDKGDTVIEISASDNWKGLFDKLPIYDQDGNEFIYRAVETALIYAGKEIALKVTDEPDYGKNIEAEGGNYTSKMYSSMVGSALEPHSIKYTVSMNNILKESDDDTTSLTVIKKWQDENNRDRVRPGSITVNLLRDGVKVDTQTIIGPEWKYTWNKLPMYQNGETKGLFADKSVYTVTEESVEGYETEIAKSADNQYTITNTHIPEKASITADKLWEDFENNYSTRPKEIYLRLMYKYADEGDSDYRIVPEYSKTEFDKDGMYTSENAENVFTTSKATQKCTGKDNENWSNVARWENLPIMATPNGTEYEPKPVVYKVIEVPAIDAESTLTTSKGASGYEVIDATIDEKNISVNTDNNVKITNSLITTELSITKSFEDGENKYNTRPDSIEVQILRRVKTSEKDAKWQPVKVKGGLFGEDLYVTLTKAELFSTKLSELPKYDKDGNEYEYSCLEKNLIFGSKKISADKSNVTPSYDVSGSDAKITNTLITTSLTVEKVWEDNSNKRKSRPEKIAFVVERKETKDIASQIISALTALITGQDGYSELKTYKDGKEETVEIVIEGPDFKPYTLAGLPAYSEDGNPYSYRAIETKLVYAKKEILVGNKTSLYKKPVYQMDVVEDGKDSKGNSIYKYNEKVVNKIIPIKDDSDDNSDDKEPDKPSPSSPTPVTPSPVVPPPKYQIIEDGDPDKLPDNVKDKIYDLIDHPDEEKIKKLYEDLIKIIQEDPTFIDKLDPETADIVIRFLQSGVLGRKRSKLPKTGGVVGSVMALLLGASFIGLGIAVRPEDESEKKKKHKSDRKA